MAVEFPAFLKLEYRSDNSAGSTMLADLDRALSNAEGRFREFSSEAKRQLDQALSISRNDLGSLDLNVPQMRAAAKAQQARATAAREIAAATRLAAKEEGDYSRTTMLAVKATEALAREEEQAAQKALAHVAALEQVQQRLNRTASATDMVVEAQRRGTTANQMMAESMRGQRVAFIQTGQQLQDMAIQFQMGTRASTIFAQQIPQLAFAMTSLEGSSNKTMNRIGQFATMLSGPLSIALVAVSAGLGMLIDKFILSEDSAKKSGDAMSNLTDVIDLSKNSYESLMAVVDEYNDKQRESKALTYEAIIAAEDMAKANLKAAEATLEFALAEAQRGPTGPNGQGQLAALGWAFMARKRIEALKIDVRATGVAAADERAKRATDPRYKIQTDFRAERFRWRQEAEKGIISLEEYERRRIESINRETAALEAYDKAQRKTRDKREKGPDTRLEQYGAPLPPGRYGNTGKFGENRGTHKHAGLDFAAPTGTPVYATQAGTVKFAAPAGSYGNLIKIDHGAGTETRYGHLSAFNVKDGQQVAKGDIIGRVGSTGRSTGSHLHYEVRVNGKPVDPTKGQFPFDASKVAEEAEKARKELEDFGNRSAEKITRINEAFDEQPRLIDRANQATRELDATIADLEQRKPEGWQQMIEDAKDAKATVEDALVRPFREMREEGEKRITVQRLLTAGREDEAEALERIWQLENTIGPLKAEQKQEVLDQVRYERAVNEELQRRQEIIGAYLDATRSVKQELVSIFSGEGSFANLGKIFRNLNSQILVEKLFGGAFRDFDKWVKGQSGLTDSVDYFTEETQNAGDAAQEFAAALTGATATIRSPGIATAGSTAGLGIAGVAAMFGLSANDNPVGDEIVATSKRLTKDGPIGLDPTRFATELTKNVARPFLAGLDSIFGTKFFARMEGVLGGALAGYYTGGPAGGILGALQGIPGLPKGISAELTKALKGSQTGTMVAGVGSAFGLNLNATGAQIGGAIGSFIPIPGGGIIGSIAGGILGSLFGKRPRGAGSVSSSGVTASANDKGITDSLNATGSGIQDAIKNIADALGASVGAYSIGIGRYKDYYQVSTNANDPKLGKSNFGRNSKNAVYDGLDAEAAMAAAISAVLSQGAIKGISAASQKILSSAASKDLQAAIEKAVLIESIPKRLKALTDPVGAAIDELNKEFEKMVAALKEGGATAEQFAQAQKLYELERAEAVKRAVEQVTGSLKSLYESLTIGNDALSLRDRKAAAMAAYTPLAARVAAGDTTAYDEFAQAARNLLDIERQISGSQSGYFDLLKQVTDLTKSQLDAQNALITAANSSDSPFANNPTAAANDNQGVIDAIGQTNNLLNAINQNIILMQQGGGGISLLDNLNVANF